MKNYKKITVSVENTYFIENKKQEMIAKYLVIHKGWCEGLPNCDNCIFMKETRCSTIGRPSERLRILKEIGVENEL